jgi:hypothetical protein
VAKQQQTINDETTSDKVVTDNEAITIDGMMK